MVVLAITGVFGGGGGQKVLHQKMRGLGKMVRQTRRCTQRYAGKAVEKLSDIVKCFWFHFKFSWKGHWICDWAHIGPNCFSCRAHWCMGDAKDTEEVRQI